MKIEDICFWKFKPELYEGCDILCPECDKWSSHEDWWEGEVSCSDCGSHAAIVCPKCDEYFDHIHGPTFEVW